MLHSAQAAPGTIPDELRRMLWPQPGSALSPLLVSLEDGGHGHQMAAVRHRGGNRAWWSLSSKGTTQWGSASASASLLLFYVAVPDETLDFEVRMSPLIIPINVQGLRGFNRPFSAHAALM